MTFTTVGNITGKRGCEPDRPSGAVAVRYALLQVPGLLLAASISFALWKWFDLPSWVPWTASALWVAKDLLLFPLLWRSYLPPGSSNPLVGAQAVASGRIEDRGRVRVGGELWSAVLDPGHSPVEDGQAVRVRAVRGLTLSVEPLYPGSSPEPGDGAAAKR